MTRQLVAVVVAAVVGGAGVLAGQALTVYSRIMTVRTLAGDDLGFRVEGMDRETDRMVGTFVVRVGGRWIDIQSREGGDVFEFPTD